MQDANRAIILRRQLKAETDGSSERTNQSVEIALRLFVHGLSKPSLWTMTLPTIQALFINVTSAATSQRPNEAVWSNNMMGD